MEIDRRSGRVPRARRLNRSVTVLVGLLTPYEGLPEVAHRRPQNGEVYRVVLK